MILIHVVGHKVLRLPDKAVSYSGFLGNLFLFGVEEDNLSQLCYIEFKEV
jgi:hypothetical protein